jgi:hypothetical protein
VQAAVELIQIRTLAEAGVPLARRVQGWTNVRLDDPS